MKKPIAVFATAILTIGLAGVGAQSASANTWTQYCIDHQFDQTQTVAAPSTALYCQMQIMASMNGYVGPINGVMGVNSWKGVMQYLHDTWNYTGPVNGVPGVNTYKAMQRAGNAWDWFSTDVVVDGTLETKDWQAWAYVVRVYSTGW